METTKVANMRLQRKGKAMVDIVRLKAKMAEKKHTVSTLADALGIDKTTLYRKMSDRSDFSINEVDKIIVALKLDRADVNSIFFSQFVA